MSPEQPAAVQGRYRKRVQRLAGHVLSTRRIVGSGIVDLDYCQAQTGKRFRNKFAAAWYYVTAKHDVDFSLHPLFEPAFLGSRRPRGTPAIVGYLTQELLYESVSPHPIFSLAAADRYLQGAGVKLDGGAWLTWARTANDATPVPVQPPFEPISWGELRATLIQCATDWRTGRAELAEPAGLAAARPPTAGLDSVIIPIVGPADSALSELALLDDGHAQELVCLVRTRSLYGCLRVAARTRPSLRVCRSVGSVAGAWISGAAASAGDHLVFVAPGFRLGQGAVETLSGVLKDRSVALAQPLNERPDMTIHSAGAYFAPGTVAPTPLLSGFPTSDAERIGLSDIPAVYSGVVAVRTDLYFSLGGFDKRFANDLAEVDLSLRATESGAGRVVSVPDARVTRPKKPTPAFPSDVTASVQFLGQKHAAPTFDSAGYLSLIGFEVAGHEPVLLTGGTTGAILQVPKLTRTRTGVAALPSLRWTIDTPVTAGWWAETWGDWHFAAALARALRRLGQHVAVDTKLARGRETRRFDDVLLTIRGLNRVAPAEGRVNLMWVISHPDDVTAEELAGYDRVFAASESWAAERSAAWGVPISPLLQCTDATLFHPGRATSEPNDRALFVGNYRPGRIRPIVAAAVASGVSLDLYGTGWENTPAAHKVLARRVQNDELGRLYAEAGVVLNDHWDDMRRLGFISNRLFDAVACGSRVLSDIVAGAGDLFGGSVLYCDDSEAAERLLRQPREQYWADRVDRLVTAEMVRQDHSFDCRARVLLRHAIEIHSGR